jgi:hypothetical protein
LYMLLVLASAVFLGSESLGTNLSPDDYTLWKATKKFKRPTLAIPPSRKQDRTWARTNKEKANQFAEYLS